VLPSNFVTAFSLKELDCWYYRTERFWRLNVKPFAQCQHRTHTETDRQTDWLTDWMNEWRTDGWTGIPYRYRASICCRTMKMNTLKKEMKKKKSICRYQHNSEQAVWEAATIYPAPALAKLTFDRLTLKVVSESRETWTTSVSTLVFLGLAVLDFGPMYATERQTSDTHQRLMPPPYGGAGIISAFQRRTAGYQ